MFKENAQNELISYIRKLDEDEQKTLLNAFKKREALKQATELDKKQRAYNKGRKKPSIDEIVKAVREVRRKNAKKALLIA